MARWTTRTLVRPLSSSTKNSSRSTPPLGNPSSLIQSFPKTTMFSTGMTSITQREWITNLLQFCSTPKCPSLVRPSDTKTIWQQSKDIWRTQPGSTTLAPMKSSTLENPTRQSASECSVSSTLYAFQHLTTLLESAGCGKTFISTNWASSMVMTRRNPSSPWTHSLPEKQQQNWSARPTRNMNLQGTSSR
ncbi:hypothetical protein BGX21_007763, partial [Mortierella sp. AD011]